MDDVPTRAKLRMNFNKGKHGSRRGRTLLKRSLGNYTNKDPYDITWVTPGANHRSMSLSKCFVLVLALVSSFEHYISNYWSGSVDFSLIKDVALCMTLRDHYRFGEYDRAVVMP